MEQPDGAGLVPSFAHDLPLTCSAIRYAGQVHHGRLRESDQAPFILHPLEVAALLHHAGADDAVVAGGVLHDVVEQDAARLPDIRRRFGSAVSTLVEALTEDGAIASYAPRKAALRAQVRAAGGKAATIFAADKLAKVRELRVRIGQAHGRGVAGPPDGQATLGHYTASLAMLEGLIPDSPLVRQLRFELEVLDALPPGTGLCAPPVYA